MRRALIVVGLLLLAAPATCSARRWRLLEKCTLVPTEANDGDSFHVKYKRKTFIFRLYFADCPETDTAFPERVAEQAAYFGLSTNATLKLGHQAAAFTRKYLANGFTVWTKFDDARGRSKQERFFAIVKVGDEDLAEVLVGHGLARIFGQDTELPDGTRSKTIWWRLQSAERAAKRQKLGGWSPDLASPARSTGPPAPATPPAPAFVAAIAERDLVVGYTIPVFSLNEPFAQVGLLERGAKIRILKLESPTMVRVRFAGPNGKTFEAQCRRTDLGF